MQSSIDRIRQIQKEREDILNRAIAVGEGYIFVTCVVLACACLSTLGAAVWAVVR